MGSEISNFIMVWSSVFGVAKVVPKGLDIMLGVVAIIGQILLQIEFELAFKDPYLSTSLQDFWGHSLELLLGIFALLAKTLTRAELETQFKDPYRATSLQDFWGRRWNLSVSNILHPTVYKPVRALSARFMSRKCAPIPAILATFLVSGLMHELIFYNFGRVRPNGQALCFFLLHGFSLSVEIVLKQLLNGRFRVPGIVSGPLALAYVVLTSIWLFFPPFLRAKAEVKACTEALAFIEFVINHRLVNPSDLSCPYL
ncbi:hypothetical protein RD792_007625 [Penstemon davidsonii]|uniref:Wax synthase domain-containing protein n=1 Tax=Penstemon davidsonii TaxID=160366 RepID=A0ABR0D6Y1_9LAMI|nr:hypothetical protein RD792_007625 [Penstemon davidsonii]